MIKRSTFRRSYIRLESEKGQLFGDQMVNFSIDKNSRLASCFWWRASTTRYRHTNATRASHVTELITLDSMASIRASTIGAAHAQRKRTTSSVNTGLLVGLWADQKPLMLLAGASSACHDVLLCHWARFPTSRSDDCAGMRTAALPGSGRIACGPTTTRNLRNSRRA